MSWSNLPSSCLLCLSLLQICANLDSAIVSTKNCALELKKVVPRPIKTFDIVEKRLEVRKYLLLYILMSKPLLVEFRKSPNFYKQWREQQHFFLVGSIWSASEVDDAADT